jgi:hypothetical protein
MKKEGRPVFPRVWIKIWTKIRAAIRPAGSNAKDSPSRIEEAKDGNRNQGLFTFCRERAKPRAGEGVLTRLLLLPGRLRLLLSAIRPPAIPQFSFRASRSEILYRNPGTQHMCQPAALPNCGARQREPLSESYIVRAGNQTQHPPT